MRQVSWARGGALVPPNTRARGSLRPGQSSLEVPRGRCGPWSCLMGCFWEKDLTASLHRVLKGHPTVANTPGVCVDLKVVPTGAGLVLKEVDGVEAVLVQAVQAVALVPALREDVKGETKF